MDTDIPKKAKTGSKRHTTPSSLIRSISKRLSAPIRSQNKHAFRQNEHVYSGESSQTTCLNERRGITKRGSEMSLMNSSKSSRPSSAASSSMQSRSDSVMPTLPTSSAETWILGVHKISGPMASAATASSMLQKYSKDQLVDVGRRETRAEGLPVEGTALFENVLPASKNLPASPSVTAAPSEIDDGPLIPLPLDLDDATDFTHSSSEYISPRSQWKMTISDLLTKEEQTPANAKPTTKVISHEHQASINELRQYIRDCSSSSTIRSASETSTSRTDLSQVPESIAEVNFTGGPIFEEPCCISETVPLSDFSAEPKEVSCDSQTSKTSGPIFKEPCCISETVYLSHLLTELKGASSDLELSKTSMAFSTRDNLAEKDENEVDDKAPLASEEELTYTGPLSLSNPLFRQALQPSPAEEESDREDYFCNRQTLSKPLSPPKAVSNPPPVPDPILLDILSRTRDEGRSGEEMRQTRHALVTKILDRNPEKWSGGTDVLDVRIENNKRMKERRFIPGEGWTD